MSTIACDGKSIAGDGLVTCNDVVAGVRQVKVYRLANGSVVGLCGDVASTQAMLEWLRTGCASTLDLDESARALVLGTDGVCTYFDHKGMSFEHEIPAAVGSGEAIALAAMKAGQDAHGAVRIACELDVYSGGEIVCLSPAPTSRNSSLRAV